MTDYLSLVSDLISQARPLGLMLPTPCWSTARRLSVASRQGKIEHLERSEGRDLGLRVLSASAPPLSLPRRWIQRVSQLGRASGGDGESGAGRPVHRFGRNLGAAR